jgi:sec-independent protein translocase protein TatA
MNFALLPFAFFDVGGPEVLVIMFIILLLFGGQKLPELAKGLGKSMREFKKAASNVEEEFKRAIEEAPEPAKPRPKLIEPQSSAGLHVEPSEPPAEGPKPSV